MAPKPAPKPPPAGKNAPPKESLRTTIQKYLKNPFKAKGPPKTPISGFGMRIKNAFQNNYRGLIGVLVPVCALVWQGEKGNHAKTVELLWMAMFWGFLVQPVAIPPVGLLPVFVLPMAGVLSSVVTCSCYMNDDIVLYLLSGMLILLLNNSGVDRRIALWFVCSGDACQYSAKRLIFKFSSASFFLSIFSNRLLATSNLTQYATAVLTKMDSTTPKADNIPNFTTMRYIINNAIQVSAGIGGTAILHCAPATVLFRAVFQDFAPKDMEYPDIFNFLQYSAFAFPVAFFMFIFCLIYHMILSNYALKISMPSPKMEELQNQFLRFRQELPRRVSLHEKLSVLFLIIYLLLFFFRWGKWITGWAEFGRAEDSPEITRVKDATVASIFVILLHTLPKSYGFLKFFDAERKSELPPLKPESSILWWRFVDRNVNYGYYFVFGASSALLISSVRSGLAQVIGENIGTNITGKTWNDGLFLVLFIITLLTNVMSAVPACAIFLPFVLSMSTDAASPWPGKIYAAALGVGIASSFGFSCPFLYTPAYFCHTIGKVPTLKMAKYSFVPIWICLLTLFIALMLWAPFLFDPDDNGIMPVNAPGVTTTTTTEGSI